MKTSMIHRIIFPLLACLIGGSALVANASDNPQLVPVTFNEKSIPKYSNIFGASQKYAIYSADGQPITFNLEVHPNSSLPVEVILNDAHHNSLFSENFTTGTHQVEIPVPSTGTYFVEILTTQTIWHIEIPEHTSAVLCLEAGKPMKNSGGLRWCYFYVPLGVREVQFTAETGHDTYKLEVQDPSGEVVLTFTENEPPSAIPIPEGMDGQVWGFNTNRFAPSLLSFENIPNYIASSPNALLLPKELVEKDGL